MKYFTEIHFFCSDVNINVGSFLQRSLHQINRQKLHFLSGKDFREVPLTHAAPNTSLFFPLSFFFQNTAGLCASPSHSRTEEWPWGHHTESLACPRPEPPMEHLISVISETALGFHGPLTHYGSLQRCSQTCERNVGKHKVHADDKRPRTALGWRGRRCAWRRGDGGGEHGGGRRRWRKKRSESGKCFIWVRHERGAVWTEDVWGLRGCQMGRHRKDRAEICRWP